MFVGLFRKKRLAFFCCAVDSVTVTSWVAERHQSTTWTVSVCTGALILGGAGVLQGLRATTHWRAIDMLARFGATAVRLRSERP